MAVKGPRKPRKTASAGKETVTSKSETTPIVQPPRGVEPQPGEFQRAQHRMEEEIRFRAYQLFEERGRQEGQHHDDWVRAEAEIRAKHQRAKSA
jgi:Protein of unknown function (DUF2934)